MRKKRRKGAQQNIFRLYILLFPRPLASPKKFQKLYRTTKEKPLFDSSLTPSASISMEQCFCFYLMMFSARRM
jgi:hypothetical protein